jgi:quercetin dioxygenase-like cupin family protein
MAIFHAHAMQLAQDNPFFQRVLVTGTIQISAVTLEPHEDIGAVAHPADLVYLIGEGTGELFTDGGDERVASGDLIFVPAGERHNLSNTSEHLMKGLVLCAPPLLSPGTVHRTKAEARHRQVEAA